MLKQFYAIILSALQNLLQEHLMIKGVVLKMPKKASRE